MKVNFKRDCHAISKYAIQYIETCQNVWEIAGSSMGNTETDGPRRRRPSMLINKRRTGWKKREAAKAEVELRGGGRWEVGETEEDACARYSNSSSTWPASGQCAHPGPICMSCKNL